MKSGLRLCVVAVGCLLQAGAAQDASQNWDVSIWIAAATGEELTNSFAEAQTWSAGVALGHVLTPELGRRWWRGQLEYSFSLSPIFVQSRPRVIYGVGFEPVMLRWNSCMRLSAARPYIELAGGGLRTSPNFPFGDTSKFNFTARGGGGLYIPLRGGLADVGLSWSHISNANLGVQNPEFNGVEIRVGYHWLK